MTTTVFNRKMKSGIAQAGQAGDDPAVFNSSGIAEVTDAEPFLAQYGGLEIPGKPGFAKYLAVAGDAAATTITVPTGKSWRLLSCVLQLICDATVANRNLTVGVYDSGDTKLEEWAQANAVASSTTKYQVVFQDSTLGNLRVEPAGTLSMATQPTATDTMIVNGQTFTFVAALTGAANEIKLGALVANTQATMDLAFGATPAAGDHSVTDEVRTAMETTAADFAGNDMVFTYAGVGSASVDGEALATTETFTAGGNVFDAATLGTTTAGVDAGSSVGTRAFPHGNIVLTAGDYVKIDEPTESDSGDDIDIFLTYLEFDAASIT